MVMSTSKTGHQNNCVSEGPEQFTRLTESRQTFSLVEEEVISQVIWVRVLTIPEATHKYAGEDYQTITK
jgi:hypothetical protein